MNFKSIDYLSKGNPLQRNVYKTLITHQILDKLSDYNPIVVGTIPIDIAIEGSDVDIILECYDTHQLELEMQSFFGFYPQFKCKRNHEKLVVQFTCNALPFEIYAAPICTTEQMGYLHMVKEHHLLIAKGEKFKQKIIRLKSSGYKTEPAFCKALGIAGDPYLELLKYSG